MPLTRQQVRDRIADLDNKDHQDPEDRRERQRLVQMLHDMPDDPPAPRPALAELLATPVRFRAWLEGLAPAVPFARSCDACGCPLAKWLEAELGCPVTVHPDRIIPDVGDTVETTAWVKRFIAGIDVERGVKREIVPAEALRVVGQVWG